MTVRCLSDTFAGVKQSSDRPVPSEDPEEGPVQLREEAHGVCGARHRRQFRSRALEGGLRDCAGIVQPQDGTGWEGQVNKNSFDNLWGFAVKPYAFHAGYASMPSHHIPLYASVTHVKPTRLPKSTGVASLG